MVSPCFTDRLAVVGYLDVVRRIAAFHFYAVPYLYCPPLPCFSKFVQAAVFKTDKSEAVVLQREKFRRTWWFFFIPRGIYVIG